MDFESIMAQMIVHSGGARSAAMEAIALAKSGDIKAARVKHKEASAALSSAHKMQAELIGQEAEDGAAAVTLLMAHAQDHLMNALTIKDMAEAFIDLYEIVFKKGAL